MIEDLPPEGIKGINWKMFVKAIFLVKVNVKGGSLRLYKHLWKMFVKFIESRRQKGKKKTFMKNFHIKILVNNMFFSYKLAKFFLFCIKLFKSELLWFFATMLHNEPSEVLHLHRPSDRISFLHFFFYISFTWKKMAP